MTQGEIEDYVRQVIEEEIDHGVIVARITARWTDAQDDAFERGQHSVIDSMR